MSLPVASPTIDQGPRGFAISRALIVLLLAAGVVAIVFLGWGSKRDAPDGMSPELQTTIDEAKREAYRPVLRASELAWKAKIETYRPVAGGLKASELAWLYDGKTPWRGIVVDLWDADTHANIDACVHSHDVKPRNAALCGTLTTNMIVAVYLHGIKVPTVAFVPVSRIAKVDQGDEVTVIFGEAATDGRMETLPRLAWIGHRAVANPAWQGQTR